MTMKNIGTLILGLAICGCAGPSKDQPELGKGAGHSALSDSLIDAEKIEKRKEGLYYLKGGKKPFTGSTIKHHENGAKKEVETYKEGKYHGVHMGWYADGKKEYETTWDRGVQNGLTVAWHENGVKSGELTKYMGGIEGDFLEWYPSGKLKKKSVYKNDISINYLAWHENGKVKLAEDIHCIVHCSADWRLCLHGRTKIDEPNSFGDGFLGEGVGRRDSFQPVDLVVFEMEKVKVWNRKMFGKAV